MDVERIDVPLVEDTFGYVGRESAEWNANTFKSIIKRYSEILGKIIESDFDKLTDKELYDLLSNIYKIEIEEKDILKMLSMYNNKNYRYIERLGTKMAVEERVTEGHGRSFDCYNEKFRVSYSVATTFSVWGTSNCVKEYIKQKINSKDWVLLREIHQGSVNSGDYLEEYEKLPTLDLNVLDGLDNKFFIDHFDLFGKLLRERFPKKYVLKDVKEIINDLYDEMQLMFAYQESKNKNISNVAKICKEWYDNSDDIKEYFRVRKALRDSLVTKKKAREYKLAKEICDTAKTYIDSIHPLEREEMFLTFLNLCYTKLFFLKGLL